MLLSTIVAVALGHAGVSEGPSAQFVPESAARSVGTYAERVDRDGTVRLSGFDRVSGRHFQVEVEKNGDVLGKVGEQIVSFHVAPVG